ncbi:Retrovirus-related Pol polyprotein from transposon TNT 1-94 [Lucilia cuprina]|nr:Retrovirus-related Pol polyprotein from transposon TNT 1-94 [Lucilia cuprina]
MVSLYEIEKLGERNYDSWCIQMRNVLIHNGWWKLANGTAQLEDAETEQARALWEADDENALATIRLCLKPSQINIIKNCQTSREAWLRLEEKYRPKGPLRKLSLYKRLMKLKMTKGVNTRQHIDYFTELVKKLSNLGIIIQEELLVIMLLNSLPSEYESFVASMEASEVLPNLSTVKEKIIEEGDRQVCNGREINGSQRPFFDLTQLLRVHQQTPQRIM